MTAIADATDDSTVAQLVQIVSDLQETVETQAERIDELERELDNQSTNVAGAFTKLSEIDDRLDDLETQQPSGDSPDRHDDCTGCNDDRNGDRNGSDQTPLKAICALPEHVAARELTANQERARFIATDVRDYAEKAPAGLVIDSRAIKRVIAAKEGDRPHTQTVARIMEFLDQLGKKDVEQTQRRGRKLVAIDPEAADRLSTLAEAGTNHDRCDGGSATGPTESVIGSV